MKNSLDYTSLSFKNNFILPISLKCPKRYFRIWPGSYSRQISLATDLSEIGRIDKTIFILNYISDESFTFHMFWWITRQLTHELV